MKISGLLAAGIAGTTAMTLFSHFLAKKQQKKFNEPEILSQLIARLGNRYIVTKNDKVVGYLLHYISGIIFTYFFIKYIEHTNSENLYCKELLAGFIAGIAGVGIWQVTLKCHQSPPHIPLKDFYFQLVIAHLILAVSAIELYKKIE